jgi:hypothetical protein
MEGVINVIQFEVGKTYYMSSVCDSDCVWCYEIIKRTAKTVTLQQVDRSEKPMVRRISIWNDHEIVKAQESNELPVIVGKLEPSAVVEEIPAPSVTGANVLDFTARLRAKQEAEATQKAIDTFKADYLPYISIQDAQEIAKVQEAQQAGIIAKICMRIDLERSKGAR